MKVAQACHRGVLGPRPVPSLFSESDDALPRARILVQVTINLSLRISIVREYGPRKLMHSCGVILVLSASARLAQY